jgi:hypothetical protein
MEQALVVEQETLGVRRGEWKGLGKEGRKEGRHEFIASFEEEQALGQILLLSLLSKFFFTL